MTYGGQYSTLRVGVDDQMIGKEVILNGWFDNSIWCVSSACVSSTVDLTKNGITISPNASYQTEFPLKTGVVYNIGRYAWSAGNYHARFDLAEFIIYSKKK
jgi:hypothetical protein